MLFLDRKDMESLLPMAEVITALEDGFREFRTKGAQIPLRFSLDIPSQNGAILFMPAFMASSGRCGTKVVSVFPGNPSLGRPTIYSAYLLHNPDNGELLALMEAGSLTGLRTGGASALAARYLAREDAQTLGIFGCGFQAVHQVQALMAVRSITKVLAYDRDKEKLASFSRRMETLVNVESSHDVDFVVRKSDILVTATTAEEPVFSGNKLTPGAHVNAIGAFRPTAREVDFETVRKARVVVDTYEGALSEAGEILIPISEGRYRREDIHAELGELVTGEKSGRQNSAEITLFKSVGHALEDCVVATVAYRKALSRGLGRQLELMPGQ